MVAEMSVGRGVGRPRGGRPGWLESVRRKRQRWRGWSMGSLWEAIGSYCRFFISRVTG